MEKKALKEIGDEFVKKLQEQFDNKNLNFTGDAKNSLEAIASDNKLTIYGLGRILFLEIGRRPGKMPPIEPIEKWVIGKLNVPEDEARGVAFAIAKKIAEKGTDILTDRAKGLQVELVLDELNKELSELILNFEEQRITGGLLNAFK